MIPTPKILVKDHKKPKPNGNFPTRLVVPASNFSACFPKLGYMGIKKLLDDYGVKYGKRNIVQSLDLKKQLESMKLNPENITLVSVDAVNMYPSIKFSLIHKAITHYTREFSQDDRCKVNACLDFIKTGMDTTLLYFDERYYLYDGDVPPEDKGLTIGGFESAWLADLAMSFLLERMEDTDPIRETKYLGTYRDDGIAVFPNNRNENDIGSWLDRFQHEINNIAGNDFLKFTAVIWQPPSHEHDDTTTVQNETQDKTVELPTDHPGVSTWKGEAFPYLDVEIYTTQTNTLAFRVHLKPNQQLKYLNKGSSHTTSCFKAIPHGVEHRLTKLTTVTEANKDAKLDDLYPIHYQAMRNSRLPGIEQSLSTPTLATAAAKLETTQTDKEAAEKKKRRERDRKRSVFFKIGFSHYWSKPIHKIIKEVKGKFPALNWLRVSMSYHRFPNATETLQADLVTKLNKTAKSLDFADEPCNCQGVGKNNKICAFGERCRNKIVVYKVTCKKTGKIYIGCTQQNLKNRIQKHIGEAKDRFFKGKKSDSFAFHFSQRFPKDAERKGSSKHIPMTIDVVWQGNPLACVKHFGTPNCTLCNRERLAIIKLFREDRNKKPEEVKGINLCSEIYGACRHKPRFHRFKTDLPNTNTDETLELGERVSGLDTTTSQSSATSAFDFCQEIQEEVPTIDEDRRPCTIRPDTHPSTLRPGVVKRHGYATRFAMTLLNQPDVVIDDEPDDLSAHPAETPFDPSSDI